MRAAFFRLGRRSVVGGLSAGTLALSAGTLALGSECFDAPRELNDCYDIGRTLGTGAFATVKLATSRLSGESFALKLISKAQTREILGDLEGLDLEVRIMRTAGRHPNLVSLVEDFEMPEHRALILEVVTGGEIFDRLAEQGTYSERDAAGVVRQLAQGLQHLHRRGIGESGVSIRLQPSTSDPNSAQDRALPTPHLTLSAHRDVKPENCLLVSKSKDADVKLCDFGLARFTGDAEVV